MGIPFAHIKCMLNNVHVNYYKEFMWTIGQVHAVTLHLVAKSIMATMKAGAV